MPSDLSLRRPSLDDVFLALTGRGTRADEPEHEPRSAPSAEAPHERRRPTLPPARLPASRPSFTDAVVIARRNLLTILRTPQLLVFSTIQPVMFVLLFRYVFGGAINVPAESYASYLLPGIFVQTVVFGGTTAAVALAYDLKGGIIDRFRSLPMARSAVLAGRTAADAVRNLFVICLMIARRLRRRLPLRGRLPRRDRRDGHRTALRLRVLVVLRTRRHARAATRRPRRSRASCRSSRSSSRARSSSRRRRCPRGCSAFAEHQPISKVANAVRGLSLGTATTVRRRRGADLDRRRC